MNKFHNPYNFIPLGKPLAGLLGQAKPAGHDRYHKELWSGRIEIEIETVTPLLIPDAARAEESKENKDHKIFAVRSGPDGRPLLPATSLKGALRSAYEAVTNSRLPFFKGHGEPIFRRMKMAEALPLIPARVSNCGKNFTLCEGRKGYVEVEEERHGKIIRKKLWLQSAAWLNRYSWPDGDGREVSEASATPYENGAGLPQHGDAVICELVARTKRNRFAFWQVRKIWRASDRAAPPLRSPNGKPQFDAGDSIVVKGAVCITGPSIGNKHDERVFFSASGAPRALQIPEGVRERFALIVQDYKERHREAIQDREKHRKRGDWAYSKNINDTAFSRHVWEDGADRLKPGTFCYVVQDEGAIAAAYPVMIGRELGWSTPEQLLPEKMRPAAILKELSPADRVFGWVNQNGKGAHKGQLRVHSIECETPAAIETFDPPLPLAILGEPKVAQSRFYAGKENGSPLDRSADVAKSGYFDKEHREQWGLRGRKVYPHHAPAVRGEADKAGYWDVAKAQAEANKAPAEQGRHAVNLGIGGANYREYLRRRGKKDGKETGNQDSQNRSIREWVKPETEFNAVIEVVNLNLAELGVLLWLLNLPEDAHHRLGGGKPLGFGSAKISVKSVDLATGAAKQAQYRAFFDKPVYYGMEVPFAVQGGAESARDLRQKAEEKFGKQFAQLPNARAFLQAARGFPSSPTHYPRTEGHPNPAGENFKWFGENESGKPGRPRRDGQQLALPAITEDTGLPLDPTT